MKVLGFIIAFALFIPVLLPAHDPAPVRITQTTVETEAPFETRTPLEAAKEITYAKNHDLRKLVSVMNVMGDEINTPEGHCLAQAVYFEARSEPLDGQLAVAQVVLNRVETSKYPNTICGVVFQNEHIKNRCQFSFACDGLSDNPYEMESWELSRRIAYIALSGYWDDITDQATHYHANYVSPFWATRLEETGQFGRHVFYRYRDAAS